ncbi:UNVERIFIED_CONTAM: hypothetical protein K2H54_040254 [Gekko kuhli]
MHPALRDPLIALINGRCFPVVRHQPCCRGNHSPQQPLATAVSTCPRFRGSSRVGDGVEQSSESKSRRRGAERKSVQTKTLCREQLRIKRLDSITFLLEPQGHPESWSLQLQSGEEEEETQALRRRRGLLQ